MKTRLKRFAYLAVRVVQIAFWMLAAAANLLARLPIELIRCRPRATIRAAAAALRFMLERLGATFIKMGQIASTRPDLFAPEVIGELKRLQENVGVFPTRAARAIIREDLGRPLSELFSAFDETPVAAASVAQVYRARLATTGETVAIKVRRPSIALWAGLDQSILLGAAHLFELVPSFALLAPVESARQFCIAINRQLDFRIEAVNSRRFRANFAAEPDVVFPRLIDGLCSDRVLTMEYLEGFRVRDLDGSGIDSRKVAGLGLKVFCKMTFLDGFVHADLHPGNVRFLAGNRIALFDLGLTVTLSQADRMMFARTMFLMANGMGRELARHMYGLCEKTHAIEYAQYEREVAEYIARFVNQPLGEIEMSLAIGSFLDIFRRYGMRLDGRFTMLNISMMVVEGIGKKLDPAIDITAPARPYLEAAMRPLKPAPPTTSHGAEAAGEEVSSGKSP